LAHSTFEERASRRYAGPAGVRYATYGRRRGPRPLLVMALVLALAVVAFLALAFVWSKPKVLPDSVALARIDLPFTGGTITSVRATGPNGRDIPLAMRNGRLWPQAVLAPGEPVTLEVAVRRAGWIGWLAGKTFKKRIQLRTPSAKLRDRFVTLAPGSPVKLSFDQPVTTVAYGSAEHLHRVRLATASSAVSLHRSGEAGSIEVAAAARTWEKLPAPALVSWFPAGAHASAVVNPRPRARISPTTPIYVTFSQDVASALGHSRPSISPAGSGAWHSVDSHTIVYRPYGYGYGLAAPVTLTLPHNVRAVGGGVLGAPNVASWRVPPGSMLRVQQILAQLRYMPLDFTPARRVPASPAAQERAAIDPPAGGFAWRYGNTPGALRALWSAGHENVITKGALMAFENDHGLTADGIAGPAVWRALLRAAVAKERSSFGYTFVTVSESAQQLELWHDGSTRITTPVNTGIASAPTALGTFPVYEHIASGTMSGTNPDGSHYSDPGVPWISYFNGGDALHGFERAQYGMPQSLGCVEMPPSTAGAVWPFTPIGTLVHVT
jgi:L,D-transpeptidase catalytic domain/Putative peptidoglycan binding domain